MTEGEEQKSIAITKKEYVKLLEEHFEITHQLRNAFLDERLPPLERSILEYKEKYSVKHPVQSIFPVMIFVFFSSLAMAVTVIWVINEIIKYPVDYSIKNILVISAVFFLVGQGLSFLKTVRNNRTVVKIGKFKKVWKIVFR